MAKRTTHGATHRVFVIIKAGKDEYYADQRWKKHTSFDRLFEYREGGDIVPATWLYENRSAYIKKCSSFDEALAARKEIEKKHKDLDPKTYFVDTTELNTQKGYSIWELSLAQ